MNTGMFSPAIPANAASGVADQLRRAILDGLLSPGARIREVEVAAQTGVSRGPVREALRMLSDEGLVILRHNRGATVAGISPDDAVEIYAVRGALALIAFRAIVAAGNDDSRAAEVSRALDKVKAEQLEALHSMASGDSLAFVRAEYEFQNRLVEVAGLDRVSSRFAQLTAELSTLIAALKIEYPDVSSAFVKYSVLLSALQARDYEAAELHWRNHIKQSSVEFIEAMPEGAQALRDRPWMLSLI